jgi:lysophospholipase L1-like esterase
MWLRAAGGVGLVTFCAWSCAPKDAGSGGSTAATTGTTTGPSSIGPSTDVAPTAVPQGSTAPTNPAGGTGSSSPSSGMNPTPSSAPTQATTSSNVSGVPHGSGVESSDVEATSSESVSLETRDDGWTSNEWSGDTNAPGASGETNAPVSDDPNRDMTIWIAGDSTVANGSTPCPTGWGKHLGALFNEHTTIRNSAAGGRSVRTWMYNVLTEMGPDGECLLTEDAEGNPTLQARWQEMLDGMKAGDALLVQFGINDGSSTCDRHVGLDAFKQSYGVLADAAKERGVQPVFITPVSMIKCSGSTPVGSRGAFVDVTIEAGEEFGVPVLDLHARSVARFAELGFCPVAGGDVSASTTGPVGDYFCDDHTHFSSSGAVDIAALVVELMVDAGVSFTSHLK